jgi:PAS domain S-box-containing protein
MPFSMPLPNPNRPARLLIVDDEEGLLFLMTSALRHEGYEVESLESGQAALEWLRSNSADLLLLDLNLGDLPAPVIVERLRRQGREFPFLIITAQGDERTVLELMKQGALDYVMKDKGLIELLPSVVRRALAIIERERKLTEANEALRRREERHRRIIQTALDGFARVDANCHFLEVNEALCRLLGYTREELLNTNAREIEGRSAEPDLCNWILQQGELCTRFFTQVRRRDGALLDVEISLHREGEEIFGFVHDITQQRRLEREVLEISEDERRRFGRDLHDGLGQQLTALELMSHTLERELNSAAPELASSAEEIAKHTRRAIAQTRQLAHGLAPVALEAEGLMVALNDLATLTARTGVECELECVAPVTLEDPAAATHLYRIAQEAVNNALKHAKAKRITLRLQDLRHAVELTIEDDGVGLTTKPSQPGMGLQVMDYRARLIGGRLDVSSEPGKGLRLVCSLPRHR